MDDRLVDLERRLAAAEETIAHLSRRMVLVTEDAFAVKGPLRVVDADNRLLVELGAQREWPSHSEVGVFNSRGVKVAAIGDDGAGGYLAIRNHEGRLIGYLSIESEGARLIVDDNKEQGGVVLFAKEDGGGINIGSKTSSIELWTTNEGSQIAIWNNNPLRMIASLSVAAVDGSLELRDKDGQVLYSRP